MFTTWLWWFVTDWFILCLFVGSYCSGLVIRKFLTLTIVRRKVRIRTIRLKTQASLPPVCLSLCWGGVHSPCNRDPRRSFWRHHQHHQISWPGYRTEDRFSQLYKTPLQKSCCCSLARERNNVATPWSNPPSLPPTMA